MTTISETVAEELLDTFPRRHIGPTPEDVSAMLQFLGYDSLDAFMDATVPEVIRSERPLAIGPSRTEQDVLEELRGIAALNKVYRSYIGLGYYNCHVPPVIQRNVLENPGWFARILQEYVSAPGFPASQTLSPFDNEIRLYRSPDKSFVLLAYLWDSRSLCPVHDHNAWGIIGSLLHPMREVKYRRLDDGRAEGYADLEPVSDLVLGTGETGVVLPLNRGIHRTGAALDLPAVSLGVYGRSIRQGPIHFFSPEEKKTYPARTRVPFRKVLALRALDSLGKALGLELLPPSLLEALPDALVREFRDPPSGGTSG